MNKLEDFENIKVKNTDNRYIVDEFIRYYIYIYSNYENSEKSSKENYYKLLTIKKIIDIVSKFKDKIISGNQFKVIKGIGEKTITRINEIIDTGKLSEIKENKFEKVTSAIKELSSIYGIGPSKASYFYETFKIKNINDLIKADKKGVITLSNQMKLGIKYKDSLNEKIPSIFIEKLDKFIQTKINKLDKKLTATICGSYRRKKNFSSDIDILITHQDIKDSKDSSKYLETVVELFSKYFIIDRLTEEFNTHFQGFASFKNIPTIKKLDKENKKNKEDTFNIEKNVFRIDIIIVPHKSFYTALLHFTGSGSFNQKMRLHAKSLNMKLNEYNLIKYKNKENMKEDVGGKIIEINSEEDVFKNLLLKYLPPEER
jgi:DNA polymerase/3'-5' exonuclease PolX